jgi:hypothetical protein
LVKTRRDRPDPRNYNPGGEKSQKEREGNPPSDKHGKKKKKLRKDGRRRNYLSLRWRAKTRAA